MPLIQVEKSISNLSDKFLVNPFYIIRKPARAWQDRKKYWIDMGIASEEGRDVGWRNALPANLSGARGYNTDNAQPLSIFDPVLCEIVYTWFSAPGEHIFDPFAGGSVRGVMAGLLGRNYTGIDLSSKQIIYNRKQDETLRSRYPDMGEVDWIIGDSEYEVDKLEPIYDMLFTCPPYYNLEQYTYDPRDLSRQETYDAFLNKYSTIIYKSCEKLKDNSFAAIVVGEVRSDSGEYYGLVPDTISIFKQAGLKYYNEIILEDNIGTLPVRGPKYFKQSRKIGKQHQNLLVFYKGDFGKIRDKCERYNQLNNFGD